MERWREGAEGGRERGRKVEGGMERQKGGGRGQKEGRRDGEAERWREGAEGRREGWMERWTAIQLSMLFVCLFVVVVVVMDYQYHWFCCCCCCFNICVQMPFVP